MKFTDYHDIAVSVADLELGMHVVALDRPWQETNFMLQGFVIRTQDEIHQLQSQCEEVFVQVAESKEAEFRQRIALKQRSPERYVPGVHGPITRQRLQYKDQVTYDNALPEARVTFDLARNMAHEVIESFRFGRNIDPEECRRTVTEIVDQVLKNKDTLWFLSQIKNKDDYTAQHSMNVCILSATFARYLGFLNLEIKSIALCGLLHDVGKSKIPLKILNKPGKFTPEQAKIMSEHTTHGRNLLMALHSGQRHAVEVAYSHHERIDGQGYPRGLAGDDIPYYSKIISVVDAYDAMTSERVYGKPKTSSFALDILQKNAGTQFDEQLVKQFVDMVGRFPVGSLVELNSGEVGVVMKPNDFDDSKPTVLVVGDENKLPCASTREINLALEAEHSWVIYHELPNGSYGFDVKDYIATSRK